MMHILTPTYREIAHRHLPTRSGGKASHLNLQVDAGSPVTGQSWHVLKRSRDGMDNAVTSVGEYRAGMRSGIEAVAPLHRVGCVRS